MIWLEYLRNNYRKDIPNYQYTKILKGIFELKDAKEYDLINKLFDDLIKPDSSLDVYVCLLRSTYSIQSKINHEQALEKVCKYMDDRGAGDQKHEILHGMV